jgi:hypothetical protein
MVLYCIECVLLSGAAAGPMEPEILRVVNERYGLRLAG